MFLHGMPSSGCPNGKRARTVPRRACAAAARLVSKHGYFPHFDAELVNGAAERKEMKNEFFIGWEAIIAVMLDSR